MNQILAVENKKSKNKKKKSTNSIISSEVSKIVMFFAISLIIFGIFMTGTGSYAIYKIKKEEESKPVKPEISVNQLSDDELQITVTSQKSTIDQVSYYWNNEESKNITGNGKNSISETVLIPGGDNKLTVISTNSSGQQSTFEQQYYRETDIVIQLEATENGNLRASLEGNNNIVYMTYQWDDGQATKIDINNKTAIIDIEPPQGKHTLKIVAEDENGKTETKVQQVNGVMKPEVSVTTDGDYFIIHASDEEGLSLLEVTINEDPNKKYKLDLTEEKVKQQVMSESNKLEYKFPYPLEAGENKIVVTLYNTSTLF